MNATIFATYLKECLVPKLKRGDVVMMDSLPVHRVAAVRDCRYEPPNRLAVKSSQTRLNLVAFSCKSPS
jgi:hypothetical protein